VEGAGILASLAVLVYDPFRRELCPVNPALIKHGAELGDDRDGGC